MCVRVSETIDSIIPLMVSSLRDRPISHEDLLMASKDLVPVLTDTTNHVQRHGRVQPVFIFHCFAFHLHTDQAVKW